ncbi:MAG: hypothetical protein KF791_07025 [Verrucomicrobiae bacterium]|nr:hypothetical protein [Verrucomicrobiae bacterium]
MNACFPVLKGTAQLGVVLTLLNLPIVAQQPVPVAAANPPPPAFPSPNADPSAIRFNLSFPGGTVVEFVSAVSKARGTPVNVVILPDDSQTMIPPLNMHQVDVPTLFAAVTQASSKSNQRYVALGRGASQMQKVMEGFGFQATQTGTSETPEVWVLRVFRPPPEAIPDEPVIAVEPVREPETVRFFNLESLLTHLTIDDITTVLSAGNELRTNGKERLNLKFHKETQLLIVRGTREELAMVEEALRMLEHSTRSGGRPPPTRQAK